MARILIVDDQLFARTIIRRTLEGAGHEIVGEAENGRLALDRYAELHPDLVLLDITMPEMDGLTTLKLLFEQDHEACVVMSSALGQDSKVREALSLGARDFIIKPYQPERLCTVVQDVLEDE
jgi:two-component system chemotaxis response regulator CheY